MATLTAKEPARMSAPSIKNMIDRFRHAPATDRDKRERLRLSGAEAEDWWKHTVDETDPAVKTAQENMYHLADTVIPRVRPAPTGGHAELPVLRQLVPRDPGVHGAPAKRWDVVPVSPVAASQSSKRADAPAHGSQVNIDSTNPSRLSASPREFVTSAEATIDAIFASMSRLPAPPVLPAASGLARHVGGNSRNSAFLPVTSWMLPTTHKQHREVTAKSVADDLDCALITFRRLYGVSAATATPGHTSSQSALASAAASPDTLTTLPVQPLKEEVGATSMLTVAVLEGPKESLAHASTETLAIVEPSVTGMPPVDGDIAAKQGSGDVTTPMKPASDDNTVIVSDAITTASTVEEQPNVTVPVATPAIASDPLGDMSRSEVLRSLAACLDASLHNFAHKLSCVVSDPDVLSILGRHIPPAASDSAIVKSFADLGASVMPSAKVEPSVETAIPLSEPQSTAVQGETTPEPRPADELDALIRELQALAGIQKVLVDEIHDEPAAHPHSPQPRRTPVGLDTPLHDEVERSSTDAANRADPLRQSAPASLLGELKRLRDVRKSWTFAVLHQRNRQQILQLMPTPYAEEAPTTTTGSRALRIDPRASEPQDMSTSAPSRAPRLELSLAPERPESTQSRLKELLRTHKVATQAAPSLNERTTTGVPSKQQEEKPVVVNVMDEEKSAQSGFSRDSLLADHATSLGTVVDRDPAPENSSIHPPLVSSGSATAFIPLSAFLPTMSAPSKQVHLSDAMMQWPAGPNNVSALSASQQPAMANMMHHSFPASSPIIAPDGLTAYNTLETPSSQAAAAASFQQPMPTWQSIRNASAMPFAHAFAREPRADKELPAQRPEMMPSAVVAAIPASSPSAMLSLLAPSYTYAQLMRQHEEIASKMQPAGALKWGAEQQASTDFTSTHGSGAHLAAAAVSAQTRARETLRRAAAVLSHGTSGSRSRIPSPSASDMAEEDFTGDYVDLSGPRRL